MHTTKLRKVGGSIMLAVPPAILDLLQLGVGATVGISVEDGRLNVEPRPQPRYTLAELLAASDYAEPQTPEEREWVDAPVLISLIVRAPVSIPAPTLDHFSPTPRLASGRLGNQRHVDHA